MSPIPRCPECKEMVHGRACFCQRHAGLKSQKADPQSGPGEAANSGRSSKGNRAATNAKNKQSMKKIQNKAIAKKVTTTQKNRKAAGQKGSCIKRHYSPCGKCGRPEGPRHLCKGNPKGAAEKGKDKKETKGAVKKGTKGSDKGNGKDKKGAKGKDCKAKKK